MENEIPDLWPCDLHVDVLSPTAILKVQESYLAARTQGVLRAQLTSVETDKLAQHGLDIIAPSLNFYRVRVLSVTHEQEMLYPVTVASRAFLPIAGSKIQPMSSATGLDPSLNQRQAATDTEFTELVRQVLQSNMVRGLINSLLARINLNKSTETNGTVAKEAETNGVAAHDEKQVS